jgi:hypothetical protein
MLLCLLYNNRISAICSLCVCVCVYSFGLVDMAPRTGRSVKTRTTTTRTSRSSTAKDAESRLRKTTKKETVKADASTMQQKSKQVLGLVAAEQKDESNSLASAAFITSSPRPSSRRKDLGKRSSRELELSLEPQGM